MDQLRKGDEAIIDIKSGRPTVTNLQEYMQRIWVVTIGLEHWTGLTHFCVNSLHKPIHAIKTIKYTSHLVRTHSLPRMNYDGSDSSDECKQNSIHS